VPARRLLPYFVLCLAIAAAVASPASARRTMLVGVDDDWVKWRNDTSGLVGIQRDAGFESVKVSFPWRPGMLQPGTAERHYIERLGRMTLLRQHVVLAFTGSAAHPPQTRMLRDQFCGYAHEVVESLPAVTDVVIWNETNSPSFWRPQEMAPAKYGLLLGRCWDVLHGLRPEINVISSTAARHEPLQFLRSMAKAYKKSHRPRPLVDTFGHNPYPLFPAEPPSAVHAGGYVGQGDYPRLVETLQRGFSGTPQPVPGRQGAQIWYLEDGFQTRSPFGTGIYSGRETESILLPPLARPPFVDQAGQLTDALKLAYCGQPYVGAFFNFQLADEKRLGGWQSGLLWANWQPKPSREPVRHLISEIGQGAVSC
jgi:hypothetical protein